MGDIVALSTLEHILLNIVEHVEKRTTLRIFNSAPVTAGDLLGQSGLGGVEGKSESGQEKKVFGGHGCAESWSRSSALKASGNLVASTYTCAKKNRCGEHCYHLSVVNHIQRCG